MRSPAFPPRRPSHVIRYVFPAVLLLCIFYYLSSDSDRVSVSDTYLSAGHGAPVPDSPDAANQPTIQHPPPPPAMQPTQEQEVQDVVDAKEKEQASAGKLTDETNKAKGQPDNGHGDSRKTNSESSKEDSETGGLKSGSGKENINSLPTASTEKPVLEPAGDHPIDELIRVAEKNFNEILTRESNTLAKAAGAYRERRGRHPPPGFDTWYQFAKKNNAVIVEDFFDQIYHDLNPFWGLDPKVIRKEAWDFEMTINIRNGNASAQSDWFWTTIWLDMLKTIEHMLPDMDIALNAMDEPRIVVPWEDMTTYMQKADHSRKLTRVDEVISTFQKLPAPGKGDKTPATRKKHWDETSPFWQIARRGCPPDSPARRMPVLDSYDHAPNFSPSWATPHQYQGYVSNYTLSTEFCHQPDLQGLEGIFIHPLSTSSTKVLFPLFGGSKLATNNEILLPAPMYWNEEERFTGGEDHGPAWEEKFSPLIWRGVATGGRNQESNWRGFQRHRFVAMNNGTKIMRAEDELEPPINFELPDATYGITARKEKRLGEWVSQWADVGFTDLMCDPDFEPKQEDGACAYTDKHFEVVLGQDLADQFTYKYLPDIDGNSFSGRYLGFLRSTGVPIKSTMWHEWHDSRLVAWKHFVPMDNRFGDYYGIMEYFLGYDGITPSHDTAAKKIAMDGKAWAEKALRKEDMQIYVLRLLLEYARLCDEHRDKMGWVDDLLSS